MEEKINPLELDIEVLSMDVLDTSVAPKLPFMTRHRYVTEKKVLELWFKYAPEVDNAAQLQDRVACELGVSPLRVGKVVRKARLREMAKEQRALITKELYEDKIPIAKAIIGMNLSALEVFFSTYQPRNISDALILNNITLGINNLLRLESGKSTANIDLHVTQGAKSAKEIIEQLKVNDPFKDYDVKS